MKKLFLVALCVAVCVSLVAPALAGGIVVRQNQSQVVVQAQASIGGFSASAQGYNTGAKQGYVITKSPTFLSPSSGVAAASTNSNTVGGQVKFGNGIQAQGMLGSTINSGGLHW